MSEIKVLPGQMVEILAQITAPHFKCGIVLWDDKVIQPAPIVAYMRTWTRDRVREYCAKKNWRIEVVTTSIRSRPSWARRKPKA